MHHKDAFFDSVMLKKNKNLQNEFYFNSDLIFSILPLYYMTLSNYIKIKRKHDIFLIFFYRLDRRRGTSGFLTFS